MSLRWVHPSVPGSVGITVDRKSLRVVPTTPDGVAHRVRTFVKREHSWVDEQCSQAAICHIGRCADAVLMHCHSNAGRSHDGVLEEGIDSYVVVVYPYVDPSSPSHRGLHNVRGMSMPCMIVVETIQRRDCSHLVDHVDATTGIVRTFALDMACADAIQ